MRSGCFASLALYAAVGLVLLKPAILPLLAGLVLVLIVVRAVISDPDWPLWY